MSSGNEFLSVIYCSKWLVKLRYFICRVLFAFSHVATMVMCKGEFETVNKHELLFAVFPDIYVTEELDTFSSALLV
jgi:hypothetical protein